MKSCPGQLRVFWSSISDITGATSSSTSRSESSQSTVPGPIVAASLSAAAAARFILDPRQNFMPNDDSAICAALASLLVPASHLLSDVPFSCALTAPAAAELIIRVLAARSSAIDVSATDRELLLASVAEYALHLAQTSASSSSPAPIRRAADNSSRR